MENAALTEALKALREIAGEHNLDNFGPEHQLLWEGHCKCGWIEAKHGSPEEMRLRRRAQKALREMKRLSYL